MSSALLHHVVEGQLGGVSVCMSHPSGGLLGCGPGENVPRPPGQAAHHASPCREGHVSSAGQAVMKTIGVARTPIVARLETGRACYRSRSWTPLVGHTAARNACSGAPPRSGYRVAHGT